MSVMCNKCEHKPTRFYDCATGNDKHTAEVLAEVRLKGNEKHWDDFLWATRLIGMRRTTLLDVQMLTEEQRQRAARLLESAGYKVSDEIATVRGKAFRVFLCEAK
jgi:hypothetical protein